MEKIRVLVVDDSSYMRYIISKAISEDSEIEVIEKASNGIEAIEKIKKLNPDVITLDVEMPKMDGITTLQKIMEENPMPVIMLSALTKEASDVTIRALQLGAVDFVCKPLGTVSLTIENVKEELISKIKIAKKLDVKKLKIGKEKVKVKKENIKFKEFKKVVAIASSTGGVNALHKIIPEIPGDLPCSFLVVQHMPSGFTNSLAKRLNDLSNIEVKEAEEKDLIKSGLALIAPGGYHMRIREENKIELTKEPPLYNLRPAADITFKDAGEIFGKNTIAVVLTGMGSDGAEGASLIKEKGGCVIAQDEKTSVVYGMPRAVVERGVADYILPVDKILDKIVEIVEKD